MSHVKHLGFDLELKVLKIVRALMWVPEAERAVVVAQLSPVGLRRAVSDQFGLALTTAHVARSLSDCAIKELSRSGGSDGTGKEPTHG